MSRAILTASMPRDEAAWGRWLVETYVRDPVSFARDMLTGLLSYAGKPEPDPWSCDVLEALIEHRMVAVKSPHGVAKGHPVDMFLDTPKGRRQWGDLQPGDLVWGLTGQPTRILATFPLGTCPVYRVILDDGSATLVDGDHLWSVYHRVTGRVGHGREQWGWSLISTIELLYRGVRQTNGSYQVRLFQLPRHAPVFFPEVTLPIHPYILGVWLGDGSHDGVLTCSDSAILHKIQAVGGTLLPRKPQPLRTPAYKIVGLSQQLKRWGLSHCRAHEKFVPLTYTQAPVSARLDLLRGLMDTDGTCSPYGHLSFTSTSKELASQALWLVRSLGGKGRMSVDMHSGYRKAGNFILCKPAWTVSFRLPHGMSAFYLGRKSARESVWCEDRYLTRFIHAIEPLGDMDSMCIKVAVRDGMYLTNDFIPTHNTATASFAAIWYLWTHPLSKVPIILPTFDVQVRKVFFAELHTWIAQCRLKARMRPLTTSVSIEPHGDEWSLFGYSAGAKAAAREGIHAPGGVLYILDEAKGIDKAIWDAARSSLTGPHDRILAVSTPPLAPIGEFVRVFTSLRDAWKCFSIGPTPRQSPQWIADREREWPRGSPEHTAKVLGEIPQYGGDDTVVPLGLVEAAMRRGTDLGLPGADDRAILAPILAALEGEKIVGVDVARLGSDSTIYARRVGMVILPLIERTKQDTTVTAGEVEELLREGYRAQIDEVGVGVGCLDPILHNPALADQVTGVNFGGAADDPARFCDRGTEMWFQFVDWLRAGGVLPLDDELAAQLCARRYEWVLRGGERVRKLESKEKAKKRGLRSPDRADAVVLACAGARVAVDMSWEDAMQGVYGARQGREGAMQETQGDWEDLARA